MSFAFVNLLIFTSVTFLIYFLIPNRSQWIVLLIASLIFYTLLDFRAIFYLIFTISSIFICGKNIYKIHILQTEFFKGKEKEWIAENKNKYNGIYDKKRKIILAFGLLSNFGILAALKYLNFMIKIFNKFSLKIMHLTLPGVQWLLPIGLSFYTFQSIGYLIDVYRKKYPAEESIFKLALFITFFPQIIQGPIGRYDQLAPQFFKTHKFDFRIFTDGLKLMGWGFMKKLLIADFLAPFIDRILHDRSASGVVISIGVIMYMLRIYTDFSGGIDVFRGIAQCMGIEMAQNFNRPYFAISLSDYWKRWHMTLGSWMKDYLLYSITFSKSFYKIQKFLRKRLGNYLGKVLPICFTMFTVFFVVGIWHGASVKYVFFGFYNGTLIALGIFFQPFTDKLNTKIYGFENKNKLHHLLCIIKTLFLVFIGRHISSADGFLHGYSLLKRTLMGIFYFSEWKKLPYALLKYRFGINEMKILFPSLLILFVISILQENGIKIRNSFLKLPIVIRWAIYYFSIIYILLFSRLTSVRAFVYAQF